MKKAIIIFFLFLMPLFVLAMENINGIWYDLDKESNTASVAKRWPSIDYYKGEIIIPETVTYNGITYSVTSISSQAFSFDKNMTSVTIPKSVILIDAYAFEGCSGLTSITIPNSVTSIGSSAFLHCSGLTSVDVENGNAVYDSRNNCNAIIETQTNTLIQGCNNTIIPNSVTSIGYCAFAGCSGLTSVTIPDNVTSIGVGAFDYCIGLTSITIPESVTSIGECAFRGCSGLTSLSILSGLTIIGPSAFVDCTELTSVNIPNSVKSIASGAFDGTPWYDNQPDGLVYAGKVAYQYKGTMPENTKITIKEGTTIIADGAFADCSGLTSVTIPNSVTSIGDAAFSGCSNLTSVTIPNSVISISAGAFDGTGWYNNQADGLLYLSNWLLGYKGEKPNGALNIAEGTKGIAVESFYQCTGLTSATIPNSVTSIGSSAFSHCSGLTSVTISNSVTSIGNSAFWGCSGLTSVTIPNSVTSMGDNVFYGCSGLTSVTIPNSVTSIGECAFQGCSGLTSITIPNSVTSIGWCAFEDCSDLTSVTIPNSVAFIGGSAFSGCRALTSVVIPNGITSIGEETFYDCSGLTSVTIPESVTIIGNNAFYGCCNLSSVYISSTAAWCKITFGNVANPLSYASHLYLNETEITNLVIPYGVTSIGNHTFYKCNCLASVTIPGSVTKIGSFAFYGCNGLTSVTIPNSVETIGDFAFSGCSSLASVIIPNSMTDVGCGAFYGCNSLGSITIPEDVPSIKSGVFTGCSSLTSIIIPNGVTSIGDAAFYGCNRLTSVTIPSGVSSIGVAAFGSCDGLKNVYCYALSVPEAGGAFLYYDNYNIVHNFIIQSLTLYVPETAIDNYKNAYPWSEFGAILAIGDENHISFADPKVWSLCVANWDTDGNGALSYAEAEEVTDLGDVFGDNVEITSFDELQYFTGLTAIGDNAFMGCSKLASVTLPENIISIGAYAFYGCSALTSFTIPQDVNEIGSYAFRNCTGLTDVYCLPLNVPTTASNAFNNSNIGNATLHVVETSYNAYKNAVPWKNFKNMVGDIPVPCAMPVISYVEGKLVFTSETEGVDYKSKISSVDMGNHDGSEVELCVAYNVSVYAMKEGYRPSKTATATLCWIEAEPVDGVATGTMEIPAVPVLVKSRNGVITVEGLGNGTQVSVYTTDGALVGQGASVDRVATIHTSLAVGSVAIVDMGKKAVKVVVR